MNILQKIKTFLKEVYSELKKVSWFSRNEVIIYTLIVLVAMIISAAFLGGLDYFFSFLIKKLIVK